MTKSGTATFAFALNCCGHNVKEFMQTIDTQVYLKVFFNADVAVLLMSMLLFASYS